MKTPLIMGAAILIAGISTTHAPQQPGSKRTPLQQHDLSAPGRGDAGARRLRPGIRRPSAHATGRRNHLRSRRHTRVQIEGQPNATVKPGDVLFVPAGAIHSVKNVGSGNGAELATYVVEKGKPLIVLVN